MVRRAERQRRKQEPGVVFFGDGQFPAGMRRHVSLPKKSIIRQIAARGVCVLLDEFRTTKMCPCGTHELKTTHGRTRAGQSRGRQCELLERLAKKGPDYADRDGLAALNMVQCAVAALRDRGRPAHLCRAAAPCPA